MSVVVVGVSHRMASVALLERLSLDSERLRKLLIDTRTRAHLAEAVVVATCNRIEVYAEVDRFHGGVEDITDLLATHTAVPASELTPHLFARYEQGAIAHLFGLACGLDSMVVGETQILGQVKAALRTAQDVGTAGTVLNGLFQRALHVGKRAHSETALGQAGRSLVGAALRAVTDGGALPAAPGAESSVGPSVGPSATPAVGGLSGRRALVVGAGSMAALAATVLRRDHDAEVLIANRTPERAARLARQLDARAVELAAVDSLLGSVDLIVTCTGASQVVFGYDRVRRALGADSQLGTSGPGDEPGVAAAGSRQLAIIDLAMPRDVDEAVAELPGVRLINLDSLSDRLAAEPVAGTVGEGDTAVAGTARHAGATATPAEREPADLRAVRSIVASEVDGYVRHRQAAAAKPTVVALRSMAAEVVGAELQRLSGRLADLDDASYSEVEKTVRRVVDKLLHVPTVRVKELGDDPVQTSYADALRELFALEPSTAALLEDTPEPVSPSAAPAATAELDSGSMPDQTADPAAHPAVGSPAAGLVATEPYPDPADGAQPHDGKW